MVSHPLPKFKTQFSQKKKVGNYDNIALNQRYLDSALPHHRLLSQTMGQNSCCVKSLGEVLKPIF